jgi:DNA-binding LytR/AlgR family response regulator
VSKEIVRAGSFRTITVTHPDEANKRIEVFPALRADAAVLTARALARDGIEVATRMREIDPAVPQLLRLRSSLPIHRIVP